MSIHWPVNKVRSTFIDFFVDRLHTAVKSSPVVPFNDPTLLFINAGMNQFKPIFLGTADPNSDFGKLSRACNSQLCIRAGGKHNDIDDVGRDTYHHTFFEMLGSWSFGDYFKKDAILWAWELLTNVYGLPEDRLYVTYFEGDLKNNLEADDETSQLWRSVVPQDHILKGNAKDNFWEMGDTGPCGPCTEIHFDRIGNRHAAHLVNTDDPMVIEVWNVVFIQFDRQIDGSLRKLPQPCVDTGMGLERLTSILQGVHSNYDTDVWTSIFERIQKVTNFPTAYESSKPNTDEVTVAYRVIADHIRCLTIALSNGAVPDSVGRGFVLRRIIRRAIRYGVQFLNAETGFFTALVDVVCESLDSHFTHLQDPKTVQRIKTILLDEEESFAKTWKKGVKHFNEAVEASRAKKSNMISGSDAFILHDRYGFPVDLTTLLAEKENMTVDLDNFVEEMQKYQNGGGRVAAAKTFLDVHQIDHLKAGEVAFTKDNDKYIWNKPGYGNVMAMLDKAVNNFVNQVAAEGVTQNGGRAQQEQKGEASDEKSAKKENIGIILDNTNFYAEQGGQVADTGLITFEGDKTVFEVSNVLIFAGYVVHIGHIKSGGPIKVGGEATLKVDYERRLRIACNHSGTHVLNHKLRVVLEDENLDALMDVHQKGSFVNDKFLRFDFSHNGKLRNEDILRVEQLVNDDVKSDKTVYREVVPLMEAQKIYGLRQMFGEKYPDPVSVISIDKPVKDLLTDPGNRAWRDYAVELCGGTHLEKLGVIGRAVIISEEALMKGVRRIVVYTHDAAKRAIMVGEELEREYEHVLKNSTMSYDVKNKALSVLNKKVNDSTAPLTMKNHLRTVIEASIKEVLADAKTAAAELNRKATTKSVELAASIPQDEKFIVLTLNDFGAEREPLQAVADGISSVREDVAIFIVGIDKVKRKALAIATLPNIFVEKKLNAVDWVKKACIKGGGKPNAAQSGIAVTEVAGVVEKAKSAVLEMIQKL